MSMADVHRQPENVTWGNPYLLEVPLVRGKLGLSLKTENKKLCTFTLIVDVKPECSIQDRSKLYPGLRVLQVNNEPLHRTTEEKVLRIFSTLRTSVVRLALQKPLRMSKRTTSEGTLSSSSSTQQCTSPDTSIEIEEALSVSYTSDGELNGQFSGRSLSALLTPQTDSFKWKKWFKKVLKRQAPIRPENFNPRTPNMKFTELEGISVETSCSLYDMSPVRDCAVKDPSSIKWDSKTRAVTLDKNIEGTLGFKFKVMVSEQCVMYIVKDVCGPPAQGKLDYGDWILSVNDIPLQKDPKKKVTPLCEERDKKSSVRLVIQSPQSVLPSRYSRKDPISASTVGQINTDKCSENHREISTENIIVELEEAPADSRSILLDLGIDSILPLRRSNGPGTSASPRPANLHVRNVQNKHVRSHSDSSSCFFGSDVTKMAVKSDKKRDTLEDMQSLCCSILQKAVDDMKRTTCKRSPFVDVIVVRLTDDDNALLYEKAAGQFLMNVGDEKRRTYTVGESVKEYRSKYSIHDLILVKNLVAKLRKKEQDTLRCSLGGDGDILGYPQKLLLEFLNNPPNPREDFVQIRFRSLSYAEICQGWECVTFCDSTLFIVPVDVDQISSGNCGVETRLREVLMQIKMYTNAKERVVMSAMGGDDPAKVLYVQNKLTDILCPLIPNQSNRFAKYILRHSVTDKALHMCEDKATLWELVCQQLIMQTDDDNDTCFPKEFSLSAVVAAKLLEQEKRKKTQAIMSLCSMRELLHQAFEDVNEKLIASTLDALQRAGYVIYAPNERSVLLCKFIVCNTSAFITYAKSVHLRMKNCDAWKISKDNLKKELGNKVDTDMVLAFMEHLCLAVLTKPSDLKNSEGYVCFPRCFNGLHTPMPYLENQSLYVDFHGYFTSTMFVYIVEKLQAQCSSYLPMTLPYQGRMNSSEFDVLLNFSPENAYILCIISPKKDTPFSHFVSMLKSSLAGCIPSHWDVSYHIGPLCPTEGLSHIIDIDNPVCESVLNIESLPQIAQWQTSEKMSEDKKRALLQNNRLHLHVHLLPEDIMGCISENLERCNDDREDWRGLSGLLERNRDEERRLSKQASPCVAMLTSWGEREGGTVEKLLLHLKTLRKYDLLEDIINMLIPYNIVVYRQKYGLKEDEDDEYYYNSSCA